ncbi:type III PLP-dependent enzyme [Oceanobacillus sp. 1P07AA]|uniref:type III PLP-dependent enzyme n=1 Tax=Oceanobacillus sp. 1P07AA TaxID=3132293 RepID=UPI0039A5A0D0
MDHLINDQKVVDLTKKYSTPFYLYDGDKLKEKYYNFKKGLHKNIEIYYSLKANNNISIASLYKSLGSGIEIASKGELYIALKAGFNPQKIIFSGPGKTFEELNYAIQEGIKLIIVESIEEIKLLDSIAIQHNKIVSVAIRINPDEKTAAQVKMTGIPSQFGIDKEILNSALSEINLCNNLVFSGIHVYLGTQNLDEKDIIKNIKYTLKVALDIYFEHGLICKVIDFGGGFGIPYFQGQNILKMDEIKLVLNSLVSNNKVFADTKFILESGRYLLAESGMYITKVTYRKISKGKTFLIVDGGLHHCVAPTFQGRLIRDNFPVKLISSPKNSVKETVTIVGPLCTPEDCLAKNIKLPKAIPGDHICILNVGAYGLSYSPVHFLGHTTPYELLKIDNNFVKIRDKGNHDDILNNQILINLKGENYE